MSILSVSTVQLQYKYLFRSWITASIAIRPGWNKKSMLSSWHHNGLRMASPVFCRLPCTCTSFSLPVSNCVGAARSFSIGAWSLCITMFQVLQWLADLMHSGWWYEICISWCWTLSADFTGGESRGGCIHRLRCRHSLEMFSLLCLFVVVVFPPSSLSSSQSVSVTQDMVAITLCWHG